MPRDTFDPVQLDKIAERLASAPAPEKKLSKTNAIRQLEPTIRKLQRAGHSLEGVTKLLTQAGIQTSVATLQSALKKSGTGKRGRPRKDAGMSVAAVPASTPVPPVVTPVAVPVPHRRGR